MSSNSKKVLQDALELPIDDRAAIAAELLASIDGEPHEDVEAAWAKEIERRARRAVAGESTGEDWRTVIAELRAEGRSEAGSA